jgi:hypothetical protein
MQDLQERGKDHVYGKNATISLVYIVYLCPLLIVLVNAWNGKRGICGQNWNNARTIGM